MGSRILGADHPDSDLFGAIQKITALSERLYVEIEVPTLVDDPRLGAARLMDRAKLIDPEARIENGIFLLSVPLPPDLRGRTKQSPDTAMVDGDTKMQLAALVRTAHYRLGEIDASPLDCSQHGQMKAPASVWIRQRIVVGFLAPDIQRALLNGSAPGYVTPEWDAQRKIFAAAS